MFLAACIWNVPFDSHGQVMCYVFYMNLKSLDGQPFPKPILRSKVWLWFNVAFTTPLHCTQCARIAPVINIIIYSDPAIFFQQLVYHQLWACVPHELSPPAQKVEFTRLNLLPTMAQTWTANSPSMFRPTRKSKLCIIIAILNVSNFCCCCFFICRFFRCCWLSLLLFNSFV